MEDNSFVQHRVETDSLADLNYGEVREDSADRLADLPRAGALDNGLDLKWAGSSMQIAGIGTRGTGTCGTGTVFVIVLHEKM